jgi:hypothetical protein
MLISPELSGASSLKGETASAEDQNASLQRKNSKLENDNKNIAALREALRNARAGLPIDSGIPALTRQLSAQAAASGITLKSISVGSPAEITANGSAAAAGSAATAGSVAGKLFAITVTLVSDGPAAHQQRFLTAIQTDGPRRALVTSTQVTPGTGASTSSIESTSTMNLQLQVFVAPQTPAAAAELAKQLGIVGD